MEEIEIPKLEDGEEIVYLTKAITNLTWWGFFMIYISSTGMISIGQNSDSLILLILYLSFGLFGFSMGILMIDMFERMNRTLYYITTKRVIEVVGNGLFPHKPKQEEINLDDIAYIEEFEEGLEIVEKGINGELHYTGEEIEKLEKLPEDVKTIHINMTGKEAQKIIKIVIKKFLELLPTIQHPNLKDIYLNRR